MQYFYRLLKETKTKMWVNNPTYEQAREAVLSGAVGVTTNPTFCSKLMKDEKENDILIKTVKQLIVEENDDNIVADLVQQKMAQRIMPVFYPLYQLSNKKLGYVSIQGNPYKDTDVQNIIDEALCYKKLGENFVSKIPVTQAGIEAIEQLLKLNIPVIATEVMSISQAVDISKIYQKAVKESGYNPPLFLTHITGIYDDYLDKVVRRDGIEVEPDLLAMAGTYVAYKQYEVLKSIDSEIVMLGGGARGLQHFTNMVGSEMHITINWSTAEELINLNKEIIPKLDMNVDQTEINRLLELIPDFSRAYLDDGLKREEYDSFGPVVHFRDMFVNGWDILLEMIARLRREM